MTQIVVGSFSVCWQITQTKTCSYHETYFGVCAARFKNVKHSNIIAMTLEYKKYSDKVYVFTILIIFSANFCGVLVKFKLHKCSEIFGTQMTCKKSQFSPLSECLPVMIIFLRKSIGFFERHIQWHVVHN